MESSPILIVDDEPSYLELLKGLLHQEGYTNVLTEQNPLKQIISAFQNQIQNG